MSTKSIIQIPNISNKISQGDIFKNVKFNYIDTEDDSSVDVIEYEFPLAVIISQACDVIAMNEILSSNGGKPTKFMPSILMCPIYDKNVAKTGDHLTDVFNNLSLTLDKENIYHKNDYEVAERDWHYRFHALELSNGKDNIVLSNAIIDFKHYFSVPMSYLLKNLSNRIYHLDDLFAEQITLKFATFISRVAIP